MTSLKKFKRFLVECKRVLIVTKKPSGQEFSTIMKVSGLGMILIGLIGFLVMIVATFVKMINI
tara:strand:- start:487 stop:675 length:189 start_codon:yes stop_codon:yes gene_type:complete